MNNGGVKMATVRNFELMQSLEYISIDDVKKVLSEKASIKDYAYIIHDKDVYTKADEEENEEHRDGLLKPSHIHCFVRLEGPREIEQVAKWFGVKSNYIQKCRSSFSKCLQYLIHKNDKNKYQYDVSEVVSNYDFETEMNVMSDSERLDVIIEKIGNQEITRYNYTEYIDIKDMTKWKSKLDVAFRYVDDKLRKEVNRDMDVVYLQGASGTGKSTYAKDLASKKGYSVFISGSSNDILDGYQNEECIILDDIRPSVMGLSDLLKMLDNNTNSTTRSRYYNKVMTKCKLIIVTTVLDIDTFFNNVFENENEPIVQLKRRCKTKIRLTKDEMFVSYYDKNIKEYSREFVCENPVRNYHFEDEQSEEEKIDFLNEFLGVNLSITSLNNGFKQMSIQEYEELERES